MAISNGVIFIWTGTNASIPAGWSRVTDLDNRFIKTIANTSTNPNTTGGSDTHTHTSPAHSHTMSAHSHDVTLGDITGGPFQNRSGVDYLGSHTHGTNNSGAVTGGSLSSVTATYDSVSNNPPYYDVIYITPTTVGAGLPNSAICLYEDNDTQNTGKLNGYFDCNGSNSTPNLVDKYLRGANTSANAGTTGGSTTNVHTLTHTHGSSSHAHAGFTTATLSGWSRTTDSWGGSANPGWTSGFDFSHSHTVTIANYSQSVTDNPSLTTSETVEPTYRKVRALQNRTGTVYTPVGIIALWLGTIANIPSNFELVSSYSNGRYPKITATIGDIAQEGGSNTHTHTGNTHTHAGVSHNHTATHSNHMNYTTASAGNAVQSGTPVTTLFALDVSKHTITMTNTSTAYSTATTSADSSSNEPLFRTVAFIKYKGEKGGSFIFNLLR